MNYPLLVRKWTVCTTLFFASCHYKRLRIPSDAFIADTRMDETSGIVASRANPGFLYVHNDSGDSSRFFAITPDGRLKGIFYFDGAPNLPLGVRDCEDITLGGGPDSSATYVYLGDIGDNNAGRSYITIYRIKEPRLSDSAPGIPSAHVDADPLYLHYPGGPRDAETLMADPIDHLLYIVSKREDSVHIYSTPLYFRTHDTVTLKKDASLYFGSGKGRWITAGDISVKGDQILLKSYRKVFYWRRPSGQHVWETMQQKPMVLPYLVERQGEAICFTIDGKSYYTVSEGVNPELFYYKMPKFIH